jgi:hypothetical protein
VRDIACLVVDALGKLNPASADQEIIQKRIDCPAIRDQRGKGMVASNANGCVSLCIGMITNTELPSAARASARATTVVVLPSPPFMFATAITFPVTYFLHESRPSLALLPDPRRERPDSSSVSDSEHFRPHPYAGRPSPHLIHKDSVVDPRGTRRLDLWGNDGRKPTQ